MHRGKAFLGIAILSFLAMAATAAAAPPSVTVDSVTANFNSAHFTGSIDTEGREGSYTWELSTDGGANWSGFNGEGYIPPEPAIQHPDIEYGGLTPNQEYAVRLSVYVNDEGAVTSSAPPYDSFKTKPVGPPTVTFAQPSAVTGTSAHFSATVDPEADPSNNSAFDLAWYIECTPECPDMPYIIIPADSDVHPIEVDSKDLIPGTDYEVRLITQNAGGTYTTTRNFSTPVVAPVVNTSPAHVSATGATLAGSINPGGTEVSYYFEWGPGFAQKTPTKTLFAGNIAVPVGATLNGLTPGTTYPFRLVASNSVDEVKSADRSFTTRTVVPDTCGNEKFRIGPSAALPDCRAYEMVSPATSDYGDISRVPAVNDDGSRLSFFTQVAPDIATSNLTFSTLVANRTESGWGVKDSNAIANLLSPAITFASVACYSTDYTEGVIETSASLDETDSDGGFTDIYVLEVGTGKTRWISHGPLEDPYLGGNSQFVAASPDLSRIYFWHRGGQLLPGAPESAIYVYEDGQLKIASFAPDGTPAEGWPMGTQVNSSCSRPNHGSQHAVSDDGSKQFYYIGAVPGGPIYRHDMDTGDTVVVTASQRTGEVGTAGAGGFAFASQDGDTVYFGSDAQLTDKATPGGGLYRKVISAGKLEQITPDHGNPVFGLQSATAVSEDGSHVYFVSPRRFVPAAQRNASNLYVWEAGGSVGIPSPEGPQAGTTRFIAALPEGTPISRVSRDGRFALFQSRASIYGATNNGRSAVYLYDDETGDVACVSCRPNGTPSARDSDLGNVPEALSPAYGLVPRNITDDGRVFFNSSDRLIAADQTFSQDVYEYDDGRVYLISAGQGEQNPSYIADNTDDGKHVFFLSRSPLLPQDIDAAELDLYDANSGGGLPTPKPKPPICEGEACRTATSPLPPEALPTTPNFSGPPNARVKRVKKKRVKKKNKHHQKKNKGKKKGHKKKGKGR